MRVVFTSLLFWIVALVIAAPFIVWFGPTVEQRLFPVLGEQVVTVTREGNILTFSNVVEKRRACRVIEVTYSIARERGDTIDRAPIGVRNTTALAPDGTATYPPGRIGTGPFIATIPDLFLDATSIEGLIVYDCHGGLLWHVHQVFGPFPIPEA